MVDEFRLPLKQVLTILSQPFDCSEAYEAGSIDDQGKFTGVKSRSCTRQHRLVFNVKRVLESRFHCTAHDGLLAALCVINEEVSAGLSYSSRDIEYSLSSVLGAISQGNIPLEEDVSVVRYLREDEAAAMGAPTNNTSGDAIPELPMIKKLSKRKLPPDIEKLKDIEDDTVDTR